MIIFTKYLWERCVGIHPTANINRAFTTDRSERLLTGRKYSNQFKTQLFAHRWNICIMCKQCHWFTWLTLYWIITLEILRCAHVCKLLFTLIPSRKWLGKIMLIVLFRYLITRYLPLSSRTSPYEWKNLEWDDKPQANKQSPCIMPRLIFMSEKKQITEILNTRKKYYDSFLILWNTIHILNLMKVEING